MEFKEIVPWIIGACALGLSGLNYLYTKRRNKQADNRAELTKLGEGIAKQSEHYDRLKMEFAEACLKIAVLEKQMGVFWRVIETNAGKMLHAPIHHRRDELIDKLMGVKSPPLTLEEVDELAAEMQAILDAAREERPGERFNAMMMQARCEVLKIELQAKAGVFDVRQATRSC